MTDMAEPKAIVCVLAGVLVLLLPIIANNGPIVYYDTATYIETIAKAVSIVMPAGMDAATAPTALDPAGFGTPQDDGVVISGRSIYYGVLAWVGWQTSMWVVVALQALAMSWLVVTLFRVLAGRIWPVASLVTLGLIGTFSSASLFVGLAMPDVWAGLLILSLAVLWGVGDSVSRPGKLILSCIIAFAVMAHSSHEMLLFTLLGGYIAARVAFRPYLRVGPAAFYVPALAMFIGISGQFVYSQAVKMTLGTEPISRPVLTARLVDLGPGMAFIEDTCPESGYTVCKYQEKLPVDWVSFLFSHDAGTSVFAAAPADDKIALSNEQVPFAVRTWLHAPLSTTIGLAKDGVTQFVTVDIDDVPLTQKHERFLEEHFPASIVTDVKETWIFQNKAFVPVGSRVIEISAVLAVLVTVLAAGGLFREREPHSDAERAERASMRAVFVIIVGGLVLNALICGVLASPYGRFQARVVWLLPLLAALLVSRWLAHRDNSDATAIVASR